VGQLPLETPGGGLGLGSGTADAEPHVTHQLMTQPSAAAAADAAAVAAAATVAAAGATGAGSQDNVMDCSMHFTPMQHMQSNATSNMTLPQQQQQQQYRPAAAAAGGDLQGVVRQPGRSCVYSEAFIAEGLLDRQHSTASAPAAAEAPAHMASKPWDKADKAGAAAVPTDPPAAAAGGGSSHLWHSLAEPGAAEPCAADPQVPAATAGRKRSPFELLTAPTSGQGGAIGTVTSDFDRALAELLGEAHLAMHAPH
jgi:hypothetical protein